MTRVYSEELQQQVAVVWRDEAWLEVSATEQGPRAPQGAVEEPGHCSGQTRENRDHSGQSQGDEARGRQSKAKCYVIAPANTNKSFGLCVLCVCFMQMITLGKRNTEQSRLEAERWMRVGFTAWQAISGPTLV